MSKLHKNAFTDIPDIPNIVYKYRIWSNNYHKTIHSDQIVYMAAPTSFEDKKDCKLFKRYDLLTENEIYDNYLADSKEQHPHWTRSEHRKYAQKWTKSSRLKNHMYIKNMQEEHFQDYNNRVGILSLTANPCNLKMWNKYADTGKGFCVGFDPTIMFNYLGGGGKVNYYENLPDVMPQDDYKIEHAKQVYSKELKWAFEEEYRTFKFYPQIARRDDRQIKIPKEAYKQVIFGWDLDKTVIREIQQCCHNQGLQPLFQIAKIMENNCISLKPLSN